MCFSNLVDHAFCSMNRRYTCGYVSRLDLGMFAGKSEAYVQLIASQQCPMHSPDPASTTRTQSWRSPARSGKFWVILETLKLQTMAVCDFRSIRDLSRHPVVEGSSATAAANVAEAGAVPYEQGTRRAGAIIAQCVQH